MQQESPPSVRTWRTARRLTLGAIVLTGTVATVAAATYQFSTDHRCPHADRHVVTTGYTYAGIGVELEKRGEHFVVRRVFEGAPADGQIRPGAVLLSADGQTADSMGEWTSLIRGDEGTSVDLEVAYSRCGRGHETVTIERGLIHVAY